MKIGFFGTPEFSAHFCEELLNGHEILFLVSSEDKPSGRNRIMKCCPAKETALAKRIPVLQPVSLSDPSFLMEIKKYDADIYVIVAYGKKIPREVYTYPPFSSVNLHPSLLPKYRGAAPIEWALINGERETGISIQMINDEIDAGDIVAQEAIPVDKDMSAGDLYQAVFHKGGALLNKAISSLYDGSARPEAQKHGDATFCGKIDKKTAHIEWKKGADKIHNLVRGLNPKPAAWTVFRGMNFKIWKTCVLPDSGGIKLDPGHIMALDKKRIIIGTGDGIIEAFSIQPENKKIMDALSFINGYRLKEGEHFI